VFVKNIDNCPEFTANDGCQIREWLHPKNDDIDLPYSVAMATVDVGQQSYKHKLEQAEVYLITAGQGLMHIDNEEREVKAGDAIYIEPSRIQWIENIADETLCFIALVNPPWTEEQDIRLD
jgi:mannose-6-phosphate isomerase-like protein (cupin superfamily)